MKFGVNLAFMRAERRAEVAQRAEAAGFESVSDARPPGAFDGDRVPLPLFASGPGAAPSARAV